MIADEKEGGRLQSVFARKNAQLGAFCDALGDIPSTPKLGEALGDLLALLAVALPEAQGGLIALAGGGSSDPTVIASFGIDLADAHDAGWYRSLCQAYGHAKTTMISVTEEEDSGASTRYARIAPLLSAGRKLGFMAVLLSRPGPLGEEDSRVLRGFAGLAAMAVRTAQLRTEIEDLSIADRLTGLLNKRGFLEMVGRELKRSLRSGRPLAVLSLELDNLKAINERHGRSLGDQVIKGVARALQRELRGVDLVARFAAGSFYVVLAETPLARAVRVRDRLMRVLQNAGFETRVGEMKASVSIGVASTEGGCIEVAALLAEADCAMRAGKKRW